MRYENLRETKRCSRVDQFWHGAVFERASELEAGGQQLIHLQVGRTSFDTPKHIKEAAKDALDAGEVHYTPDQGCPELLEAVAADLKRSLDLTYDPTDEIVITVGGSEALFLTIAAYLEQGDEVLVPSPGYPTYYHLPQLFGAEARPIRCPDSAEFQPTEFEGENVSMMIVNSPNNPTGAVWSERSLKRLAAYARRNDILVVSDDIYGRLIFEGQHQSIAQLPGMRKRCVILGGVSKTYSMTGWRVGFAAGPRELLWPIMKLHQHVTVCAPSFSQVGATAAIGGDQRAVEEMVSELRRRRDILVSGIRDIDGIQCHCPAGTFYAFPDISQLGLPSEELAMYLLEEAEVVTVPGSLFGPEGEGHLRLSFACSPEELQTGSERMRLAIERL